MATSSITITALTATPTLRGNKLSATVSATGPAANIPTLMLDNVEFYSSASNDFTTATKVGEGNPEFLHAGLIEEQTYYYWAKPRAVNGNYGAVYPVSPTGGVSCTATGMSGLAFGLANGKLVASVAANALTIAIKTAAGNDPSTSDPVYIAFPNVDVTIGNYQIRRISAALSITVPNGGTLGISNAVPFRVWIVIFDDSGTLRIGVKVCSNSAALISPISEAGLSSSAIVSSATSSYIFYTDAAVTSKPLRIIGDCVWNSGLASAGVWNALPSTTRMVGMGTARPSQVVQEYGGNDVGPATWTSLIPFDDTLPQIGEGQTIESFSLTAAASCNIIDIEKVVNVSHSVVSEMTAALFVDGAANAIAADTTYVNTAGKITQLVFRFRVQAGSTASRTYSINLGAAQAGTTTYNGSGGARKFGGALCAYLRAQELAA